MKRSPTETVLNHSHIQNSDIQRTARKKGNKVPKQLSLKIGYEPYRYYRNE